MSSDQNLLNGCETDQIPLSAVIVGYEHSNFSTRFLGRQFILWPELKERPRKFTGTLCHFQLIN